MLKSVPTKIENCCFAKNNFPISHFFLCTTFVRLAANNNLSLLALFYIEIFGKNSPLDIQHIYLYINRSGSIFLLVLRLSSKDFFVPILSYLIYLIKIKKKIKQLILRSMSPVCSKSKLKSLFINFIRYNIEAKIIF